LSREIGVLTLASLTGGDRIAHGFFTRQGGVSEGAFASLNCGWGSGDAHEAVRENRARAMALLGLSGGDLATVYQIHSARVVILDGSKPQGDERPQADGLVTDRPGLALGILTADCVPVLFVDPAAPVIGACHAGWKGALAGVAEATVAAMVERKADPARIRAGIGPAIRQKSYEVGPEFAALFAGAERFFTPAPQGDRLLFDLPLYVRARLDRLGLAAIDDLGLDTLADETRFFSYRRATRDGIPDYGRMLSAITIR
jgi:polyphenol oxidase